VTSGRLSVSPNYSVIDMATGMNGLVKFDPPMVIKGKTVSKGPTRPGGTPSSDELLNLIVVPRQYTTNDGSLWLQRISATPATKADVIHLQESLDQKLQQKKARETGICPVREVLYGEAFGAWWRSSGGAHFFT
jgi:dynein light intermediate chain